LQRKSSVFQFCQCHAEGVHFSSKACQTTLWESCDYLLKTVTTEPPPYGMRLAPLVVVQERNVYEKD
jgi:hypothetical protein